MRDIWNRLYAYGYVLYLIIRYGVDRAEEIVEAEYQKELRRHEELLVCKKFAARLDKLK